MQLSLFSDPMDKIEREDRRRAFWNKHHIGSEGELLERTPGKLSYVAVFRQGQQLSLHEDEPAGIQISGLRGNGCDIDRVKVSDTDGLTYEHTLSDCK